ncbi:hypothetical protein FGG08_004618 [Glutinoglossum americanum]|uniref:Kinetochore complex Sim4 subunit Fta1-domain-containing protein n=1 Tax=Glutinoglossum americanum TaxID=1670608 RepID=A0A9P8L2A7_9PEZI|nr:hypothetical protein FGG08_004618 [Glutinoglossum americanum]
MSASELEQERLRPYPLYNVTLTLYRLSPLYHAGAQSLLVNATLVQHARHLKDLLAGEVLRGVRVGLATGGDEGLVKAGKLKECRWKVLGDEAAWIEQERRLRVDKSVDVTQTEEELAPEDVRGIHVEVEYEKTTYMAVLLRNSSSRTVEDNTGFTHLPLVVTRMPGPLRETFLDYLSTTFDTRASLLKLPSGFLTSSLERFLAEVTAPNEDDVEDTDESARQILGSLRNTVKDLAVTLAFTTPVTPLLKSLEITISKADIPGFIAQGKKPQQSPEPPQSDRKRKRDQSIPITSGPFTSALSQYTNAHLAFSLTHPDISISKIACGAFALGAEGKAKIFPPIDPEEAGDVPTRSQTATAGLLHGLIERAETRAIASSETVVDGTNVQDGGGQNGKP